MLSRVIVLCLTLFVAAPAWAQAPRLKVVATFSILADVAREVGGERVEVASLVGPDSDAHAFAPSPADARRLRDASVILANGLGLDGWIERLARASGTKAPLVVVSRDIGRAGAAPDPHVWQDVAHVKAWVGTIRDAFARLDPPGESAYAAQAAGYLARLDELDREIRAGIAALPPGRREVITTHDAFGYFGRAYGLTFTAPQGVSTESEATAADVARIIRQIKARKVPAVFLENVSDRRMSDRIAAESGARIGGRLYSDALSAPGGPASTYIAMMRASLAALRAALAQ